MELEEEEEEDEEYNTEYIEVNRIFDIKTIEISSSDFDYFKKHIFV